MGISEVVMSFRLGQFLPQFVTLGSWCLYLGLMQTCSVCQHSSLIPLLDLVVILLSTHSLFSGTREMCWVLENNV